MLEEVKKVMARHNSNLSIYACPDDEAIYLKETKSDIRTSFFHDIDRILYSLSFIRYQDKTQVFSNKKNDHISKRMIHVQFVSKIARTIGRALALNEDLIEAASLAHDLGHVPFGHIGESILNEISLKNNEGLFNHNIESVRKLLYVENFGQGLNISVQVLDAIMCHNGEFALGRYEPIKKTKEKFLIEYEESYKSKEAIASMKPMTLEGCVVRISDLIAYLGRDIDDAIRMSLVKREDIPKYIVETLGDNTRDIVNSCILDIIKNSYDKNYLLLSDDVYEAIKELMKFNYKYIYNNSESSKNKAKLKIMFESLFEKYLSDLENSNNDSMIISSYLNNMCEDYKNNNTKARIVIDYMSGMTDDFFLKEYKKISKILN